MKKFSLILAAFLAVASFQTVSAQSGALRSLGNKLSGAARNEVRKGVQKGVENAKQAAQDKADAQAAARVIEGKTIYVSATTDFLPLLL